MTTETELKNDIREFTGYTSTLVLSADGLDTAYRTAKRHIRVQKSLPVDYVWFDSDKPEAEEALFWYSCLFTKIQTGELDSQGLQAGAIDEDTLLSKEDDDVTTWYRNAQAALNALKSSSIFQASSPSRHGRTYQSDTFERGTNNGGAGGGGGFDI